MNHGDHGEHRVQPTGMQRVVDSRKENGEPAQKMIPQQAFHTFYIPPSVLSVSSVANSHFLC